MEYKLLTSSSPEELTEKINNLIKDGWKPMGSHQVIEQHRQNRYSGMQHQEDIREKCYERATKFAIEYGFTNVSEHIMDVMVSIMCTRDKTSHAGGGFVQAVVANDLYLALSRADTDCRNNIFLLTMCKANCFLNEL